MSTVGWGAHPHSRAEASWDSSFFLAAPEAGTGLAAFPRIRSSRRGVPRPANHATRELIMKAGIVGVLALVFVGSGLMVSPAVAKCTKECKRTIRSDFKTCKSA